MELCTHIEAAPDTDGLYRKAGNKARQKKLIEELNNLNYVCVPHRHSAVSRRICWQFSFSAPQLPVHTQDLHIIGIMDVCNPSHHTQDALDGPDVSIHDCACLLKE